MSVQVLKVKVFRTITLLMQEEKEQILQLFQVFFVDPVMLILPSLLMNVDPRFSLNFDITLYVEVLPGHCLENAHSVSKCMTKIISAKLTLGRGRWGRRDNQEASMIDGGASAPSPNCPWDPHMYCSF